MRGKASTSTHGSSAEAWGGKVTFNDFTFLVLKHLSWGEPRDGLRPESSPLLRNRDTPCKTQPSGVDKASHWSLQSEQKWVSGSLSKCSPHHTHTRSLSDTSMDGALKLNPSVLFCYIAMVALTWPSDSDGCGIRWFRFKSLLLHLLAVTLGKILTLSVSQFSPRVKWE